MKPPVQFRLLDQKWTLKFSPLRGRNDGYCYPNTRKILVDSKLRGRERLAIILHEFLHGADWWKDEEWIRKVADDAAELLDDLGYTTEED